MTFTESVRTALGARCKTINSISSQTTNTDTTRFQEVVRTALYPNILTGKKGYILCLSILCLTPRTQQNVWCPSCWWFIRKSTMTPLKRTPWEVHAQRWNSSTTESNADCKAYDAVTKESQEFIADSVNDAIISMLCLPLLIYAKVTLIIFLDYLQRNCKGNHKVGALDVQDLMRMMHLKPSTSEQRKTPTNNPSVPNSPWPLLTL